MSALAVSWDEWRASYDTWSFRDQQEFYDQVFRVCRVQQQHSPIHLADFLAYIAEPVDVVELGGWDGEFAATMLADHPIRRWTNYEISQAAVAGSVCHDDRYVPIALDDWYWTDHHACDLFVASHVLEHLRFDDVKAVLDATDCRYAYIQAPLPEGPRQWDGYHGSHILEVGWARLAEQFYLRGFKPLPGLSKPGIRCFERAA